MECTYRTRKRKKQIESRDSKITIVSRQVGPTAKNYARPSLSFSFLNLSEESLSQNGNYFVIYTLWPACRQGGRYLLFINNWLSGCNHGVIVIATCPMLRLSQTSTNGPFLHRQRLILGYFIMVRLIVDYFVIFVREIVFL